MDKETTTKLQKLLKAYDAGAIGEQELVMGLANIVTTFNAITACDVIDAIIDLAT